MENTIRHIYPADTAFERSTFSKLANQFAGLIASRGIHLNPASPGSIQHLNMLEIEKLKKHNAQLLKSITAFQSTFSLKENVSNKFVIRNILEYMGFSASEDFLEKIIENDIVEIYNLEGIQIFRNLKFYETTTYSLTDLITYEWYELYYRPSIITEKLMALAETVLKNPSNSAIYEMQDVPVHFIKEIKADPIQICEIKFKKIAPIIDRAGDKAGLIVTCEAKSMLSTMDQKGLDFI